MNHVFVARVWGKKHFEETTRCGYAYTTIFDTFSYFFLKPHPMNTLPIMSLEKRFSADLFETFFVCLC
jgi:hypothetical protein